MEEIKKTILFPTDFSESAHNAMRYGLQLYKGRGYKYILLNTVEPATASSSAGMIVNMSEIMAKDSLEGLKKDKQWIEGLPEANGCEIETVQMFGEFVSCLRHIIRDKKVDMVVMGTTGASGLKEFFVGSNAAAVIQDISIPTLTVPFNADFDGIKRIVYATDLKPFKGLEFLRFLKDIVNRREADLSILHVVKSSSKITEGDKNVAKDQLGEYFSDIDVDFASVEAEDTVEGIQGFMRSNKDVDLLTMVPRKKNFFEKIFSKSVAKKVAYHSSIPMLTLQQD
jgi:nucleotide-binding universal stress UspA family protein